MSLTRILFLPVVVMLLGTTCSDNTSEPPPANVTVEGPSSHDWRWEYTIIDPANTKGHLWDVCYINDNCIWAVGQIEHKGENYNACRWDGNEWKLEKVYDLIPDSNTEPDVHQLYTVYGTDPDYIWFCGGTYFILWNGKEYITDHSLIIPLLSAHGTLRESWGNAPNNIYMGGTNGEIVHYDGHRWKRLENDIEQDITAIHGNGDTVLVAATGPGDAGPTAFYTIVGEKVEFFAQDSLVHGVHALWFSHLDDIYAEGDGSSHFNGHEWLKFRSKMGGLGNDMAANSRWDILVAGAVSTIRHYNNEDWKQWMPIPGLDYHVCLNGCTIRGDEAWAVGLLTQGTEVLIVKGTRSSR